MRIKNEKLNLKFPNEKLERNANFHLKIETTFHGLKVLKMNGFEINSSK